MYALAICRAKQQTHYDRSPHCRTVSLTGVSSFILAELALFCGVAPLCRDGIMISHFPRRRNGTKRQFLPCAIVYFDNTAVKEMLIHQPLADFQNRASHSPEPCQPRFHSKGTTKSRPGLWPGRPAWRNCLAEFADGSRQKRFNHFLSGRVPDRKYSSGCGVCELFAYGKQFVRAADCKGLSGKPDRGFPTVKPPGLMARAGREITYRRAPC